jgi:inner membrane protein involved in colicin E2 resistance
MKLRIIYYALLLSFSEQVGFKIATEAWRTKNAIKTLTTLSCHLY